MWQPIDTAPKDGTKVKAKRVYQGTIIAEGVAAWRAAHFPALPPHPLDGDIYAPACDATGWMYCDVDKRFPEPTHWQPLL